MVGDRRHDAEGARNLHVRFVGVTWGYGPPDEFEREGVEVTVEHPDQLVAVLDTLSTSPST